MAPTDTSTDDPRTVDEIVALADAVGVLVITPGNADMVRAILRGEVTP